MVVVCLFGWDERWWLSKIIMMRGIDGRWCFELDAMVCDVVSL